MVKPVTQVQVFLEGDTEIVDRAVHDIVTIRIGEAQDAELRIFLPSNDDDALAVCDRLEAVIDNCVSAIRRRQQVREQEAATRFGAGASVEADRG